LFCSAQRLKIGEKLSATIERLLLVQFSSVYSVPSNPLQV